MQLRSRLLTTLVGILLAFTTVAAHAEAQEEARLLMASQVLQDLQGTRDQGIPTWLLQRAYAIAVIPGLTKVAFFFGGRRGHGVLVARKPDGSFSDPIFITITGGSFGFQWGVQKTDLVLVFTSPKGVVGIEGGKVTLGAGASVAAGPVGREASAATVQTFNAAVYSYSHNKGLFAGVDLGGSEINVDDDADADFYHHPKVTASQVLSGAVTSSDYAAGRFMKAVAASSGLAPASSSAATSSTSSTPAPANQKAPAAQAYPLEDQSPGGNPPN